MPELPCYTNALSSKDDGGGALFIVTVGSWHARGVRWAADGAFVWGLCPRNREQTEQGCGT